MLTNMPQAPTLNGVYQIRDFVPELNDATKSNTAALQNAFKFGTQVHDYLTQREQAKVLAKENDRQAKLKENIANDKVLLAKLEQELEQLKAGNNVELRQGIELMQQNNVPTMQSYLDNLDKMNWNWRDNNE